MVLVVHRADLWQLWRLMRVSGLQGDERVSLLHVLNEHSSIVSPILDDLLVDEIRLRRVHIDVVLSRVCTDVVQVLRDWRVEVAGVLIRDLLDHVLVGVGHSFHLLRVLLLIDLVSTGQRVVEDLVVHHALLDLLEAVLGLDDLDFVLVFDVATLEN